MHTHTGTQGSIAQPLKKDKILLFAIARMDLEGIMFNEIRQKDKLHDIIYMWNLNIN